MQTGRGVFVVIEGTDGSGKGTQFKRLAERLTEEGFDVATFDFPQYEQPSSYFVREYLNGKYGTAEDVGPYTGSLFYALDRFEAAPKVKQALEEGKVVLANRYVGSSMAHQGTKFQHAEERRGYFIWLDNLEFEMLRIPRPDLSVVLRVPAEVSQKLVDQKEARSYTDRKRDIHEADLGHLKSAVSVYDEMCQLFPKDFSRIDCIRDDKLLEIDTIHDIIWQKIEPLLPDKPAGEPQTAQAKVVAAETAASPAEKTAGNIHLLTDKRAPATLVIEKASQLLAAKLERGRNAAYVVQPLQAGQHDQKQPDGTYRYYTPEHLEASLAKQYKTHMDKLFDLYSGIVQGLTSYLQNTSDTPKEAQDEAWHSRLKHRAYRAAQAVLPVAATTTVAVHTSSEGLEDMVRRLLGDPLAEARKAVEGVLAETKKTDPEFLERLNQAESGAVITYRSAARQKVAKLARTYLSENYANPADIVQLTEMWPRNELDIVPEILYVHSTMALRDLQSTVREWPYDKKLAVFEAYLGERVTRRQRPGRALEKIHYSWDIVSSFMAFRDLQRFQTTEAAEWQELTPRFGYDIPKLVEDAGLIEEFETAFDTSLKLYSLLQEAGHHLEAQYAALAGHRLRWKVTYNAREAFHLHEAAHDTAAANLHADAQAILAALHERLSGVHPLLGEAMKFAKSPLDIDVTSK